MLIFVAVVVVVVNTKVLVVIVICNSNGCVCVCVCMCMSSNITIDGVFCFFFFCIYFGPIKMWVIVTVSIIYKRICFCYYCDGMYVVCLLVLTTAAISHTHVQKPLQQSIYLVLKKVHETKLHHSDYMRLMTRVYSRTSICLVFLVCLPIYLFRIGVV